MCQQGTNPVETRILTNNCDPGDVSFIVVWQQNQLWNEESIVEPDPKYYADAQPTHGVHHKVQAKLHGCGYSVSVPSTYIQMQISS